MTDGVASFGEMFTGGAFASVFLVLTGFFILLVILWTILPFAVFGTKPILREIAENQRLLISSIQELARAEHKRSRIQGPPKATDTRSVEPTVTRPAPKID